MNKCSIVISSYDGFEDVWPAFFTLFFRYWPDCPFQVYLISNTIKYPDQRVQTLTVGEDKKWSSNLKIALDLIDSPYVIYLQEDYFLQKPVNTKRLLSLLDYMDKSRTAYLRIFPDPKPNIDFDNDLDLGIISDDASYRTSTQAAFWDKKVLANLLIDGETGWDFEYKSPARSKGYKFLSVKKTAFDYVATTAIKKGKWRYPAIKLARKEKLILDTQKRPVETGREYCGGLLKGKLKKFLKKMLQIR